jgi:hypothetical protein
MHDATSCREISNKLGLLKTITNQNKFNLIQNKYKTKYSNYWLTVLQYSCMMPLHVEKYLTNWAYWNNKSKHKQIKNKCRIKHSKNWPTVLSYSCMMPLHVEKYLTNWAYWNIHFTL